MASSIQIDMGSKGPIGLDEVLVGVSGLDSTAIEKMMREFGGILARRKAKGLPQRESELLAAVNRPVDARILDRYSALSEKNQLETIAPHEQAELLELIEILEQKQVDRLQGMLELAHLRGISLDALRKQLNIDLPK